MLAHASLGGVPVSSKSGIYSSLAYIRSSAGSCTGVFVAKDKVMTAAHCVLGGIGQPGTSVLAMEPGQTGFDPQGAASATVTASTLHPDKDQLDLKIPVVDEEDWTFDNPDFAFLKLDHEVESARPIRVQKSILPDVPVHISAFERLKEDWRSPRELTFQLLPRNFAAIKDLFTDALMQPNFDRAFFQAFEDHFSEVKPYFIFALAADSSQVICEGDSGSPLYQIIDGEPVLVGVTSNFINHPFKGAAACERSYLDSFALLEPHMKWIEKELAPQFAEGDSK